MGIKGYENYLLPFVEKRISRLIELLKEAKIINMQ